MYLAMSRQADREVIPKSLRLSSAMPSKRLSTLHKNSPNSLANACRHFKTNLRKTHGSRGRRKHADKMRIARRAKRAES